MASLISGFIGGFGLLVALRNFADKQKKLGIIELVLTFVPVLLTALWGLKRDEMAFGGSVYDFLFHSAFVDGQIFPWLILILYVVFIAFTIWNFIKIYKYLKENPKA